MAPTLYFVPISSASRLALLTAKAIGLELDLKTISFAAKDHLQPEYLKMNPQHTVPTLNDDGYYLTDSHAISIYLVNKYAKDDSLYSNDLKKKSVVNQRLFFNDSIMQPVMGRLIQPVLLNGVTVFPQVICDEVREAFGFLELFLENHDFIAGDSLTIADFAIVTTLSSMAPFVSLEEFPRLSIWFEKMQELPYYDEANKTGCDILVNLVKSKLT